VRRAAISLAFNPDYSKRFGQPGLAQDGVGGVAAWNADRHGEFRFVIGLNQISWLPLPCRTSVQPGA
jgi:hypothetical protein